MTAEKLTVGQEVRVFDVNGKRVGQPDGGWTGEVVKIGRTLAHISYAGRTETFRIAGRERADAYGHQSFLTLDEAAEGEREIAALAVLRAHRVTVEHGSPVSLEQIEAIAALLSEPGTAEGEDKKAADAATAERARILDLLTGWKCSCGADDCSAYDARDEIASMIEGE